MPYILPRALYLNRDKTKVVEEDDPAAAFVLGGVGTIVSDEDAKLYGLDRIKGVKREGEAVAQEVEEVKATQPAQNKVMPAQANKGK